MPQAAAEPVIYDSTATLQRPAMHHPTAVKMALCFLAGSLLNYVMVLRFSSPKPLPHGVQVEQRLYPVSAPAPIVHGANPHPLLALPPCVVDTCSDFWDTPGGPSNVNFDAGGCASVQHMVRPSTFRAKDPNITAHWCKVWLAKMRCADKRYRWMIFRDDDTIFDLRLVLQQVVQRNASILASYDAPHVKWVVTNWFVLDTHSEKMCRLVDLWWEQRRYDYPEHDQKYFNHIFKCGKDGVECFDKFKNVVREVHCRSSLGYGTHRREECMRYQIEPRRDLI